MVVERNKILLLTINSSGEGVRLIKYAEETLHHNLGESKVHFKLDHRKDENNMLFLKKGLVIM